ncbi:hypothetical protein D1159_15180 [Pseudoflavonifractor sp. 524-17]|uniref:KOW domain-containing RNA-binding protein n=1 Tax=Pseudoflavonifractor sp. 524-17 TaxID=2304577 RepID=UPI00137B89C2|nr:KOW domain-containing RNA-binding protein [Pseudoflavonifractor sp. 524-17]NCE65884.1 hypothetical protein [Pseudoflavonifractor sp. 524-17]
MYDYTGWIVRSTAGHDKDQLFCVVGVDQENCRLLLADGKRRRLERPKRKKLGHVAVENRGGYLNPVIQRLQMGETVSDRALRRALAAFREESRRV